jgi:hypothetical protein
MARPGCLETAQGFDGFLHGLLHNVLLSIELLCQIFLQLICPGYCAARENLHTCLMRSGPAALQWPLFF